MPDLLRRESGGYIPGDVKSGRGKEGGDEDHDRKTSPSMSRTNARRPAKNFNRSRIST